MIVFNRQELQDLINSIDVMTGAYSEDLEMPVKGIYRHDSPGFHRLRSVQHRLYALMNEEAQAE